MASDTSSSVNFDPAAAAAMGESEQYTELLSRAELHKPAYSPRKYALRGFFVGLLVAAVVFVPVLLAVSKSADAKYFVSVHMQRINPDQEPIIAYEKNSVFDYNYNAAYVPLMGKDGHTSDCLAVRVQDIDPDVVNGTIYDVGPSKIALSCQVRERGSAVFSNITHASVVLKPTEPWERSGTEDPRVVFFDGSYYMFYTAYNEKEDFVKLALAISQDAHAWRKLGPVFPAIGHSKSGALLIGEGPPYHLFWGDQSIHIATTDNLVNYANTEQILLSPRDGSFDSELVESGPPPLPLTDGNFLFLYNSARRASIPNPKPHWHLQYNVGFVVLDKHDPTKILFRSHAPILSPLLQWERCNDADKERGLTPDVVFVEGWKSVGDNQFLVWYQGCDSFTGVAQLTVSIG